MEQHNKTSRPKKWRECTEEDRKGGREANTYLVRRKTSLGRYWAKPRAPDPRGTMVTFKRGSACSRFQPEGGRRGEGREIRARQGWWDGDRMAVWGDESRLKVED